MPDVTPLSRTKSPAICSSRNIPRILSFNLPVDHLVHDHLALPLTLFYNPYHHESQLPRARPPSCIPSRSLLTLLALTRAYPRTPNPLSPQEVAFPLAVRFEGLGALFNLDTIRHIWKTGPLLGLGFDSECPSFNLGSVVRNVSGTQSGSREPSSHRVSPLIDFDHHIHNLKYHHHAPS